MKKLNQYDSSKFKMIVNAIESDIVKHFEIIDNVKINSNHVEVRYFSPDCGGIMSNVFYINPKAIDGLYLWNKIYDWCMSIELVEIPNEYVNRLY